MHDLSTEKLVVAFNFPPFNDGSAVTVAKRIVEADEVVDVISADLSTVRQRDESLSRLVAGHLRELHMVDVPIMFADQRSITPFIERGLHAIRHRSVAPYASVYSRSMWPHSHFLAARTVVDGLARRWTAEFSDPLLWHVDGTHRPSGDLPIDEVAKRILRAIGARGQTFLRENATVLAWAQFVPFLLADELVFTNPQQQSVMIADAPEWMRERVLARSVVSPHPTLPSSYYETEDAGAAPDPRTFTVGYFGTIYPNRGGGDFLEAVSLLPRGQRESLRLEVFSEHADALVHAAGRLRLGSLIRMRRPVPFRRFLADSHRFDALLVNDIATSPFGLPSPFLPSKYSDYAGSDAAIMAITIPGSPLDGKDVRWKAHVGDTSGIARMLQAAIGARGIRD